MILNFELTYLALYTHAAAVIIVIIVVITFFSLVSFSPFGGLGRYGFFLSRRIHSLSIFNL